jgi:uncharacterized protein YfdQ (DUF2303 family)
MDDQNDSPDIGGEDEAGGAVVFGMGGAGLATLEGVGAALTASAEFGDQRARPLVLNVTDPLTGTEALVQITRNGITALPASVFEEYLTEPGRRRGSATMLDLKSFIDHTNRFKDGDSVIFANNDRKTPSLAAVLDYHRAGADSDPRFGTHRTLHSFPLSDEWTAWMAFNQKPLSMVQFGHFLEDHIIEVLPREFVQLGEESQRFVDTLGGMEMVAQPGRLMDIANNLQVNEKSVMREAQKLQSGETSIEFQTEHQDSSGNKLVLPSMFVIGIPVFKNGQPYQIIARFRYRKDGASLVFFYELWRTDRVFDHAFDEALESVRENTGLPVLIGSPE